MNEQMEADAVKLRPTILKAIKGLTPEETHGAIKLMTLWAQIMKKIGHKRMYKIVCEALGVDPYPR